MSNTVFPQSNGLKIERTKTPQWKTITHVATSGKETRTAMMSYPRWVFSLSFEFLKDDLTAQFATFAGFFNNLKGSFDSFLYLDPYDNTATSQAIGTGDGSNKVFQIVRNFGSFIEPIKAVVGSPSIYLNGVLQSSGYTITDGVLTFTTAPSSGAIVSWTGQFYFRCRFLNDDIELSQFMYDLWEVKKVEFISIK